MYPYCTMSSLFKLSTEWNSRKERSAQPKIFVCYASLSYVVDLTQFQTHTLAQKKNFTINDFTSKYRNWEIYHREKFSVCCVLLCVCVLFFLSQEARPTMSLPSDQKKIVHILLDTTTILRYHRWLIKVAYTNISRRYVLARLFAQNNAITYFCFQHTWDNEDNSDLPNAKKTTQIENKAYT